MGIVASKRPIAFVIGKRLGLVEGSLVVLWFVLVAGRGEGGLVSFHRHDAFCLAIDLFGRKHQHTRGDGTAEKVIPLVLKGRTLTTTLMLPPPPAAAMMGGGDQSEACVLKMI